MQREWSWSLQTQTGKAEQACFRNVSTLVWLPVGHLLGSCGTCLIVWCVLGLYLGFCAPVGMYGLRCVCVCVCVCVSVRVSLQPGPDHLEGLPGTLELACLGTKRPGCYFSDCHPSLSSLDLIP